MAQKYLRYEIVPLQEIMDDIFLNWGQEKIRVRRPSGKWVGVTSLRMKTFARAFKSEAGAKCVTCGCAAEFFAVETTPGQEQPHLNLYGIKDGVEILFTHDHRLARALGGRDNLSNSQLMCSPCNSNKSIAESKEVQRRRKLAKKSNN